ncbi:MAG: hypothetical protein ACXWCP_26500, partial [Burkholderiales bacterium]
MTRARLLVSLVMSLFACSVYADDPLPRARPESVGLSSQQLEQIGKVLRTDIERGRMPGAVV